MYFVLLFSLSALQYVSQVRGEEGQCVWYDSCGWDQDYGPNGGNNIHFLNCDYTGPAKPASDEQTELIKEVCPHMYTEGEVIFKICQLPRFIMSDSSLGS